MDEHIEKMVKGREETMQKLDINGIEADSVNDDADIAGSDQPLKSISSYARYLTDIKPEDHRVKLEDALKFIVH